MVILMNISMICFTLKARFGPCIVAIEICGFSFYRSHCTAAFLMYYNNRFDVDYKEYFHAMKTITIPFWDLICAQECDVAIQDLIEQLFLENDDSYQAKPCRRFPNSKTSSLVLILCVCGKSLLDLHHLFPPDSQRPVLTR